MKPSTKPGSEFVHDLIHRCTTAALASHSVAVPGYPYATSVAIAPGADHRPWMLLSGLAEHRVNLEADGRASLHLIDPDADSPLSAARATLIGTARRVEAGPRERMRFVRYQPEMEPLLALGDFAFFVIDWSRARAIGGFARVSWIEPVPIAAPFDEQALHSRIEPVLPAEVRWLGADADGFDVQTPTGRCRLTSETAAAPQTLRAALGRTPARRPT